MRVEHGGIAHVTDVEIDSYWKGTLPADEEARIEQHYLDCADCQTRVRLVETLVDALQVEPTPMLTAATTVRAWQAAAAVLAAVAVVTSWQWAASQRERQTIVSVATTASVIVVPLAPPTRDANAATVAALPAGATVVVFEIDAREAGPPGSRFDVSLVEPSGNVRLRLQGVASTDTGVVRVAVERSVLGTGRFLVEVTVGPTTIVVPVLIQPAASR